MLNLKGEDIAINTAILPAFGGSNLGVPASKLADLIAGADTASRQGGNGFN